MYYYPHTEYNTGKLPMRKKVRRCIVDVVAARSEEISKETGIVSESIFLELDSLHFPRSFPVDIMHCVLQNITPTLFKLWNGTKLPIDLGKETTDRSIDPEWPSYVIHNNQLAAIGAALNKAKARIPAYLGHAPRRIERHYRGFKAAEWSAWLTMYALPLITNLLDDVYVRNFRDLSQLYILATQNELDATEITMIGDLARDFVHLFEECYYRCEDERLPMLGINIHSLLHMEQHIRDCGPAWCFWQFPMERFAGVVKPLAKSKSQLSRSLSNALAVIEQLNNVQFTRSNDNQPAPECPRLVTPAIGAKFRNARSNLLRQLHALPHQTSIDTTAIFLRCELRPGMFIGSKLQTRTGISRMNYTVCYQEDDGSPIRFAEVEFFVEVGNAGNWAMIRECRNPPGIDVGRRLAYYDSRAARRTRWINVAWIKSLVGELMGLSNQRTVYCVTDFGLFD